MPATSDPAATPHGNVPSGTPPGPRTVGLRAFRGDESLGSYLFDREIIKIGRLASAHLQLDDPKVSRIHAVLDFSGTQQGPAVIDMGSAEGTFVNGERVSRVQLQDDDEIRLGDTRLKVCLDPASLAALQQEGAPLSTEGDPLAEIAGPASGEAASPPPALTAPASSAPSAVASPVAAAPTAPPDGPGLGAPSSPPDVDSRQDAIAQPHHVAPQHNVAHEAPQYAPAPSFALPPIPEDPITPENRHLEVTLRWGSDVAELKRIRGTPKLVVGVGDDVDLFFPLEGAAPGATFELIRQQVGGAGWVVRYTPHMSGTVTRGEATVPLAQAGGSPDDGAQALTITDDMAVSISVGHFTVEIRNVPRSRVIPIPPFVDMLFLNTAVVTLFTWATLMSVLLLSPVGLGDDDDDLFTNPASFQTVILKPPPKDNSFLDRLKSKKSKGAEAAKDSKGQAGNKQSKNKKDAQASFKAKDKPTDEQIVASKLKQLFGDSGNQGIAALFGADVSGGELQNLLGGISGAKAGESYGVGGLGLRGSGPGGGGTGVATMGIAGVGTRGRGSGDASYGSGEGGLGGKGDREPTVSIGTPVVYGSLDREIIRRVVRENQAQIKYCYEREMTRSPGLNGKIVMKWVITGSGSVRQAQVVETTMKNKAVESCLAARINGWNFPKPKGGGIVIVTYPFLFKKSG